LTHSNAQRACVSIAEPLLPWGLALAAGAVIFVVSDEIIPESHRKGFEREAIFRLPVDEVERLLEELVSDKLVENIAAKYFKLTYEVCSWAKSLTKMRK
jgi:hypothetical protein